MAVMLRRERGFNLIELMIVVAVLGIIAAIAYPAYQEYVRKGKRAEGKAALLEAAQMMERYYTNNNAYSASLSAIGYPAGRISGGSAYSSDSPSNAAYTLSAVVAGGGSSFTITATPANNHVDPKCGNLSINQAGQKGRTGTAPVNECW